MQKLKFLLTFWLALTAIGASAQGNATVCVENADDASTQSTGIANDGATDDNR